MESNLVIAIDYLQARGYKVTPPKAEGRGLLDLERELLDLEYALEQTLEEVLSPTAKSVFIKWLRLARARQD